MEHQAKNEAVATSREPVQNQRSEERRIGKEWRYGTAQEKERNTAGVPEQKDEGEMSVEGDRLLAICVRRDEAGGCGRLDSSLVHVDRTRVQDIREEQVVRLAVDAREVGEALEKRRGHTETGECPTERDPPRDEEPRKL